MCHIKNPIFLLQGKKKKETNKCIKYTYDVVLSPLAFKHCTNEGIILCMRLKGHLQNKY